MLAAYLIFVLTVVLNIAIAALVYVNNPKRLSNRLFAALGITISVWLMVMLGAQVRELNEWRLFFARLNLVLVTPMDVLFLLFARAVPDSSINLGRRAWTALLTSACAIVLISASPLTFSGAQMIDGVLEPIPNVGLPLFGAFNVGLIVASIVTLFLKIRRASEMQRLQLDLVIMGILLMIGFIVGTIFVPVLLLGNSTLVTFAPLDVLLFTGLSGYAIFKRGLLNVKVVSAELFSAAFMVINAIQLFLPGSLPEYIFRASLLFFVTAFSILFIRSVHDEVRRREDLQRMAEELEIRNTRLKQLDELKTTMVAIASHQIRGPLGGIRGYLSMFHDGDLGPLTPKQKEIVGLNLNVLGRLIIAVETFLDITKLESGKIMLRKETASFEEIVGGIVKDFKIPVAKKGLTLDFSIGSPGPILVTVDPEKTGHVIFNLIDNAMKYTEKGGIQVKVWSEAGEARCEVADTGVGIPPEDLAHLFGKYERGELATDRGGSGLGLYVVKMLLEMQGGRVWVTSPGPGQGSKFNVALPLSK